MKPIFKISVTLIVILCIVLATDSVAQKSIVILPQPYEVRPGIGHFTIDKNTQILTDLSHPELRNMAMDLASSLHRATTFDIAVLGVDALVPVRSGSIVLELMSGRTKVQFDPASHPAVSADPLLESYELNVTTDHIHLTAFHPAGVFYGIQSLRHLLPSAFEASNYTLVPNGTQWIVPVVSISDRPRFSYRGMHLDVGRHFMPVSFIKKYLDLLALHKMNTFHWHLTEDQGWRIQIDAYPLLTQVGGFRDSTLIGNYGSGRYDAIRYGGYYTKEEIREVVSYARDRYITVIPEIELPGHASAALAAYPEFGCTDLKITYTVKSTWGIFPEIFCPTEETFSFLTTVLDEVVELFPGPFIHIGGDEAMKDHWKKSVLAQEVMRREGLRSEEELQSYFIGRMDDHLVSRGRRLIGWDEILEGGLASNATVMSWRGEEGGLEAARMGHDAVMSPTGFAYFDYYQHQDRAAEPIAIGGFLPLEKVYSYEPIPAALASDKHHHILGVQGNVWTEYMKTPEKVEYMAFPRVSAMAEVGWSSTENRDYESFKYRLSYLLNRLDWLNVNYRNPF